MGAERAGGLEGSRREIDQTMSVWGFPGGPVLKTDLSLAEFRFEPCWGPKIPPAVRPKNRESV